MTIPASQKKTDAGRVRGPLVVPQCAVVRINFFDLTASRFFVTLIDGTYTGVFSISVAQVNTLSQAIGTSFTARIALYMPTTMQYNSTDVRDLNSANNAAVIATVPGAALGTSASPRMPAEVAAVLTKRTARAGRGFRGRMYIPGWATNADTGDGTILPAMQTALNLFATDLTAAMAAAGLTPCIGQPARLQHFGSTGTLIAARNASTVPITTLTCRNTSWDSQRRRGQP